MDLRPNKMSRERSPQLPKFMDDSLEPVVKGKQAMDTASRGRGLSK